MRQTEYFSGNATLRLYRGRLQLHSTLQGNNLPLQLRNLNRVGYARCNLLLLQSHPASIYSTYLNICIYSDEACLRDFQFQRCELPVIAELCDWIIGRTERNRYSCSALTETCLMLRRIASPCRWKYLEKKFGMHASALSEVFWEVIASLIKARVHLVTTFRCAFLANQKYAETFLEEGAPSENCVGFIDCTKIQMSRPGGLSDYQRSAYSGHKRRRCLIY